MLKDYGIIKRIASAMNEAASDVAQAVINDYAPLDGKEEEVTGQLRGELNRRLLDAVKSRIDGQDFGQCKVMVSTFKKRQEFFVGADLAGIFEIEFNGTKVSKAYLAQAKVGKDYEGLQNQTFVRAINKDLRLQAERMLKITSDSFVFVYSKSGIHCVPAFQVALSGLNKIDTGNFPFRSFGSFYEEFVKCFIGDHMIAPDRLNATNLEDYAKKMSANAALRLSVELPQSVQNKRKTRT